MEGPSRFLFEQLPTELNLLILNLLKPDEWIRVSSTCKRWLNNTRFITDLKLIITHKEVRMRPPRPSGFRNPKGGAVKRYIIAQLNQQPISTTLNRFAPENLRSLKLLPDIEQNCEILNDLHQGRSDLYLLIIDFITRCTNLRSLKCPDSPYLYDAIRSLTQLHSLRLKGQTKDGAQLGALLKRLIHLEELEFIVRHAAWSEVPINEFYSDLVNLKSLKINETSNRYTKFELLGKMTQLTELNLFYALIKDDEFKHFADWTNLESLSLSALRRMVPDDEDDEQLSDEQEEVLGNPDPLNGLRHLTRLSKLKFLDISDLEISWHLERDDNDNTIMNSKATSIDLADLIQRHFTNLKVLKMGRCEIGASNEEKLKQIKTLNIIDEGNINYDDS